MKRRLNRSLHRSDPARGRFRAPLALLLLLVAAAALAQGTPRIGLIAPPRVEVGDAVRLEATGLVDLPHTLRVVRPDGAEFVTTLTPTAGRLVAPIESDSVGSYRIVLEGPTLEAFFTVVVHAPSSAPDAPPPAPTPAAAPDSTTAGSALAPLTLEHDGATVRALEPNGLLRWRLSFARGSGELGPLLEHAGRVWVALGHQLLIVDPASGEVRQRIATSGTIDALDVDGEGIVVRSRLQAPGGELHPRAQVIAGSLHPAAIFDPLNGELFEALALEAEVPDVAERLEVDASNPYLWQQLALHALSEGERLEGLERLWASLGTFYDAGRIARIFAFDERWEEAERAMEIASRDFLARGYDPALLTDVATHERYAFPLQPLQRAVAREDVDAARFWARWLVELSGPNLPGAGAALRAAANLLASHGEREEAAQLREWATLRSNPSAAEVFARNALLIGRGSAIVSAGLMLALIALHLTLFAKYRRAMQLSRRRAQAEGGHGPLWTPRWGALAALRYAGLTEKLVLLMLLAAAYGTVALYAWAERGDTLNPHLGAGHLETPVVAMLLPAAEGNALALAELESYRGGAATAPSPATLRAAFAGSWSEAIGAAFREPWRLLGGRLEMLGLPAWSWPAQLTLFWLIVLWHLVHLLLPRPRVALGAPRTVAYHLLALLIPGSGQADELYGILLIVPWATFGIDVLMQLLGAPSPLGIPLAAAAMVLGVLYAVNLLAWAIEFASVRRRTLELKKRHPELAREYGLRVPKGAGDAL